MIERESHLTSDIHILDTSFVSSLGQTTRQCVSAFEAGISGIAETAIVNKHLKPINLSLVPDSVLPKAANKINSLGVSSWQKRLLRLASASLSSLANVIPKNQRVPMVLCLPEVLPHIQTNISGNFIEQLSFQSDLPFDSTNSKCASIGRAGGFFAINHALQLFASGYPYVIVGGVDSYCCPSRLAYFDFENRIKVEGVKDGLIPGEGACFLLLSRADTQTSNRLPPHKLYTPGVGLEENHFYADGPNIGSGLDGAVKMALQNSEKNNIDSVLTSHTYESFQTKELGIALMRSSKFLSSAVLNHPADGFGDMGAATGPALLCLALYNGFRHKNYLLISSSDLSHRSAICLDLI